VKSVDSLSTSSSSNLPQSASLSSAPSVWSSAYRLVAAEKWKAKSAMLGSGVTQSLVEYAQPLVGMKVIDLATGTGEPAIALSERVGPGGSVIAVDQSTELLAIATNRARNKKL
jgi:SAM-dependent methyltransferase